MSVFTTNQVRHLYVAKAVKETAGTLANEGDFKVKAVGKGMDKEVLFQVKGKDTVLTSDRIPVKNITYVKAIEADDMKDTMKKVTVKIVNNLIAGQDYVLRIVFRQFYGMSDQDQYIKDAVVRVSSNMTKETFCNEMIKALNRSFSREIGSTKDSNQYLKFSKTGSGDSAAIVIEEKEQTDWKLGLARYERVLFDVMPTTVWDGNVDFIWGETTVSKSDTKVGNGKKIAELEYFCLGERGDQYRGVGFPRVTLTEGLVDASKEYDVLEIHYTFADSGVNSYNTEKDITIVADSTGHTLMKSIVKNFQTATGITPDAKSKSPLVEAASALSEDIPD